MPVFHATTIYKLFERYILSRISTFVAKTDQQLSFKPLHGTDMCTFLLKTDCIVLCKQGYPSVFSILRCV